jgi:phospholipid/cholesterol/gamma-HCH transport system substrate-binding protein
MKITREVKTGVVAVSALALFIWGFNFLDGKNLLKPKVPTYFAEYANVQGLNSASKVTINGFQVGKVQNITFSDDPNKKGHFIVEFSVEAQLDFTKKSIAKIYSEGIMGGKALAVVPSYEGEIAKPGDYLLGDIESDIFSSVTEKLNPLQAKVESMIVQADSLLVGMNDVLDKKTRNHLKSSMEQLDASMVHLKGVSENLDALLVHNRSNIDKTVANAEQATGKLGTLTDNLNAELEQAKIAETVQELKTTLDNINKIVAGLDNGDGSLGKLLKDEKMYNNLTGASKELEELLKEMKEHPKRFVHFSVFGKKDKGYVEEEVE